MTFDGVNKLLILDAGDGSTVSVRDLWSRWVDWLAVSDNSKYLPAFAQVGGNDIDLGAGTKIPVYAFLLNGWKLRPREASHTLNVNDGILLVDGGGDPFVNTIGSYIVRVNYQQPVQAISFDSGGGGGGATAADVWAHAIEGGYSAEELMRAIVALGMAAASGGGTNTITFRDLANAKNRLKLKVKDADGNRNTPEILDLS